MSSAHNRTTSEPEESVSTPENGLDPSESGAKPGRKKNPNSAAARRDQNRIAQREFRLRKQQKIRDLEARVELLSGNKEDTYNQMREIMRALMSENQQLRNLLRDVGKFMGDGVGGPLAASLGGIGWQLEQFNQFINRSETDTAYDTFVHLKRSKASDKIGEGDGDDPDSSRKRRRVSDVNTGNGATAPPTNFGLTTPSSTSGPSPSSASAAAFATLLDNQVYGAGSGPSFPGASSMLSSRNPTISTDAAALGGPSNGGLPLASPMYGSFTSPMASYGVPNPTRGATGSSNMSAISNTPTMPATNQAPATGDSLFSEEPASVEDEAMMRKNEAGRLFRYHLDNFRRNPSYCLPRSLNPTLVQRTIPHEQIIDSIPFPELRNRMILLKDRYSLPEVIHSLFLNSTIHGDDVMQHENWELHKPWLEKYPFLVDDSVLQIANKWRRERGDNEIARAELGQDST